MVSFSTIKICIPSYKRASSITNKTLKMLENYNINRNQIYIFVVLEELEDYKNATEGKYNIVVGFKGLAAQRNYITNYFNEKTLILMLDDDIISFNEMKDEKTLIPVKDIKEVVINAFNMCEIYNAYIWGIHQTTHNPYFMRNSITLDFSFLVGHMYGFINRHNEDLKITLDIKEDYERTIKYFLKDNILIKLNKYSCKTFTYKNIGGIQEEMSDRSLESEVSSKLLIQKYPNFFKIRDTELNRSVKSRYIELKLIKNLSFTSFYKRLDKIDYNNEDIKELFLMLEATQLPINLKRLNSGIGISQSFGLIKRRKEKGLHSSQNNTIYPELYKKLLEFGYKYVHHNRTFTSIQVNKNYQSKPHIDKYNKGLSYIVGLGDYEGGELILNSYRFNIKYEPLLFNGRIWEHATSSFTGTRYSLIYFTL